MPKFMSGNGRVSTFWGRFREKIDRMTDPNLSLDDINSVVCTCLGLGNGYYTHEAAEQDRAGNKKGHRFNVAKALICQRLYELAREDAGKPVGTTAEEYFGGRDANSPHVAP